MPIRLGRTEVEDDMNRKAPLCPNCGLKMRYKTNDYGEFFGCPNYPKCRYRIIITDYDSLDERKEELPWELK